jgi:hypothetical protein
MKTHNPNLISNTNTMNTLFNYTQGIKKIGAFTTTLLLALLVSVSIQAQTADDADAGLVKDAGDGVSVKLIDNKGTIKYLQTNNGITSITSSTAGSTTTTTWQLGGTLTDDTYIDVNGNAFGLTGIDEQTGTAATSATLNTSGYTFLTRDEATGEINKITLSDLAIVGGNEAFTVANDGDVSFTLTGDPALTLPKTYVYRNGAKLIAGTDYLLSGTAGQVVLQGTVSTLAGDIIEVHFLN